MRRTPKYQQLIENATTPLEMPLMGKIKRYVRANFWLLLFTFYGLVFFMVGLFEWITSWGTP